MARGSSESLVNKVCYDWRAEERGRIFYVGRNDTVEREMFININY